jgi:hypothetical protein
MFFDTPAKGVVDVAVTLAAVCLFDAYFAQAVLGIVVVVVSSEMQQLVTANYVLVAVTFNTVGVAAAVISLFLFTMFLIQERINLRYY